jgi:hypothetical protein
LLYSEKLTESSIYTNILIPLQISIEMKVASRSGFMVFLGGILAARNVVHARAVLTIQPPPITSVFTDLIPAVTTALIAPQFHLGTVVPWLTAKQNIEMQEWRSSWN